MRAIRTTLVVAYSHNMLIREYPWLPPEERFYISNLAMFFRAPEDTAIDGRISLDKLAAFLSQNHKAFDWKLSDIRPDLRKELQVAMVLEAL